jgi:hypothetical protein
VAALRLTRVELVNFKAFDRFSVPLRGSAYLVGPNNAGKSTIISAIRAGALMVRWGMRRNPTDVLTYNNEQFYSHPIRSGQFDLVEENLSHDFRDLDTRLVLHFSNRARLTAVWPVAQEGPRAGWFYFQLQNGFNPRSAADVRASYPSIGVIPMLTPIEQQEDILDRDYVRRNQDGRLSSRHFRNQLWYSDDLDDFLSFAEEWTHEVRVQPPAGGWRSGGLDVFFSETKHRGEKELVWAGDGIQVWLQFLFHVRRLRDNDVLVLDEPDLYLHPDLQRRLVRVLDATGQQTITATHSPEILAEAPGRSLVWVDKSNRSGIAAPDEAMLGQLSSAIGTQFNIRLAKALRARAVLFVEGDDMKIIRELASTSGASRLARELDIAVVPLGGYSRANDVAPFRWLNEHFLKSSVQEWVILDRDYRADAEVRRVKKEFSKLGIKCHVWRRKELESYLLHPGAISRCSGAHEHWIAEQLLDIANSLKTLVQSRMGSVRQARERNQGRRERVLQEALKDFDEAWRDEKARLRMCPAKDVIAALNERLQKAGHESVSAWELSISILKDEIADEVSGVLQEIEYEITAP